MDDMLHGRLTRLEKENLQLQRELNRTRQRLQDLAGTSAYWSWETDAQMRFTQVGSRYFDLLGSPPEHVLGRTRLEVVPVQEQARYPRRWQQHRDTLEEHQAFHNLEYAITGKNDQTHYIRVNGKPVFDDNGEFIGYTGNGIDESARVRAQRELEEMNENLEQRVGVRTQKLVDEMKGRCTGESELRRMRKLLHNIIDSMPSSLVAVDHDGIVTQWNREVVEMSGLSQAQAIGRPVNELLPQLNISVERIKRSISSKKPDRDERVLLEIQGESRHVDITIYPLVANGSRGAVIRVDDVTDRVHMEEMMIQSEKMLSIGELAAGMAHEINNPLAGILQNIQVIQWRLTMDKEISRKKAQENGLDIEDLSRFLEERAIMLMCDQVAESGRRASTIVSNMLKFSRKSESVKMPQALDSLLDVTISLAENDYSLKNQFDFRKIELVREYEVGLPHILCEAGEIQQVILNLLKNGAQAMFSGNCSAPRFIVRLKRDGAMVRIEIEDNGPGMDKATTRRIFEPFYTTKAAGVGTGLGLSVSYFIVTENHKGFMTVESEPGERTCFIIRLPLV